MQRILHSPLWTGFVLVGLIGFLGCTPNRTAEQRFRMSFLPPAPAPEAAAPAAPEPPSLTPSPLYLHATPNLPQLELRVPPRPQLDARLRRAEERFQAGRRLLDQGDQEGARREFDRAVDMLLGSPEDAPDRAQMEKKLEDLVSRIHRLDVSSLGAGDWQEDPVFDKSPLQEILDLTFPVDPRLKPRVQEELKGTVSQLPLEVNDDVLRYVNFFSTDRGKRTLIAGLRRAGRYSAMIQRILQEEGVPRELIFLAQAESGFLPRAVSVKAATGMWQFVLFRGREYGLMQSAWHDDRLDPEKATRAAARHLRDLYEELGDWYLAMAAYNCGPGCVDRAVERTGHADFWELRSRAALPRETSNYVPLILAMTIMAKNPGDYGLEEVVPEPPLEYEAVKLDASTHLALVSDLSDVPLTALRELNPALLKNVAPAGYELRLPPGKPAALLAGIEAIPASKRLSWRAHRVVEGETLAGIAKRYKASEQSLTALNRSMVDDLEAGDLLIVPVSYPEPRTAEAKSTRSAKTSHAARKPVSRAKGVAAAGGARKSAPARTASTAKKPARGASSASSARRGMR